MTYIPVPAVTYADFVTAFPEFGNTTTYPIAQINFWIPHAYAQLNAVRFRDQLGLAVMLFVAHNVVLSARAAASAAAGQVVGGNQGILTSKAVGEVSAGYDAAAVSLKNAGIWNSTTYGARLYKMFQSYGTGPNYAPGPTAWPNGRRWFGRRWGRP